MYGVLHAKWDAITLENWILHTWLWLYYALINQLRQNFDFQQKQYISWSKNPQRGQNKFLVKVVWERHKSGCFLVSRIQIETHVTWVIGKTEALRLELAKGSPLPDKIIAYQKIWQSGDISNSQQTNKYKQWLDFESVILSSGLSFLYRLSYNVLSWISSFLYKTVFVSFFSVWEGDTPLQ